MKNFIFFLCKFWKFLPIFFTFKELKGGVRAEPLYQVNFLFFYFLWSIYSANWKLLKLFKQFSLSLASARARALSLSGRDRV